MYEFVQSPTMKTIIVALLVVLILTSSWTTAQDACDINDVTRKEVKESCHEKCTCDFDSKKSTVNADCSGQDLTSVPSHLHPCTTELDVSGCSIPHLIYDAFSSVNLKNLAMKNCNISDINVKALKSLTHLNLNGNNIKNITHENLPDGLEELDVGNNPLDCNTLKEDLHKVLPYLKVICNGPGISREPKAQPTTTGPTTTEPTTTEPTTTEPTTTEAIKEENTTEDTVTTTSMAPNTEGDITTTLTRATARGGEKGSSAHIWFIVAACIAALSA